MRRTPAAPSWRWMTWTAVGTGTRRLQVGAYSSAPRLHELNGDAAIVEGHLMAGVNHDTLAGWLTRLQPATIRDQRSLAQPQLPEASDVEVRT